MHGVDAREPFEEEASVPTAPAGELREVLVGQDVAAQDEEEVDGEVSARAQQPQDSARFADEGRVLGSEVEQHDPRGRDDAEARELADLSAR